MAITSLNTIKNWFKTNLVPTQNQFWATFDSFWHKGESIPINKIDSLIEFLDAKVDDEILALHIEDLSLHKNVVILNGNPFNIVKHPDNEGEIIEVKDAVCDGWWSATEFWNTAIYLGGAVDAKTSFSVLDENDVTDLIN